MRARAVTASCVLGACTLAVSLSTLRASDHFDGPRTTASPEADITDVFAFTSPESPERVVLAMAVMPFASTSSTFSSRVDYVFRIRRVTALKPLTLDESPLDVTCDFDEAVPQGMACTAPGGLQAAVHVGDPTSAQPPPPAMRVFAGLRTDPAVFDRQGALATVAAGRAQFTGQNAFAGGNVLAIVVELDTRQAFAATDAGSKLPMLAVAAETSRRGP